MDIAASIQVVTEEIMLRIARYAHELTGCENLCLAGGVALNCVGNGKILREGPFENIWIQPAAGDAGGALGAARSSGTSCSRTSASRTAGICRAARCSGPRTRTTRSGRSSTQQGAVYRHYADEARCATRSPT